MPSKCPQVPYVLSQTQMEHCTPASQGCCLPFSAARALCDARGLEKLLRCVIHLFECLQCVVLICK